MDEIPATQEDLFGEEPDEKTTVMVPEYASMPVKPMVTSSEWPTATSRKMAQQNLLNLKVKMKRTEKKSCTVLAAVHGMPSGYPKGFHVRQVPPATALVATAPAADSPELASPSPSVSSSLARARDKFISEWIELSDMPKSQERFKAACKAWMESTIRADFLSARAGVQR